MSHPGGQFRGALSASHRSLPNIGRHFSGQVQSGGRAAPQSGHLNNLHSQPRTANSPGATRHVPGATSLSPGGRQHPSNQLGTRTHNLLPGGQGLPGVGGSTGRHLMNGGQFGQGTLRAGGAHYHGRPVIAGGTQSHHVRPVVGGTHRGGSAFTGTSRLAGQFPLNNRSWHNSVYRGGWNNYWNTRYINRHYGWYRGPWYGSRRGWYSSILFGFSPWGWGWGGFPFSSGYYGYYNPYWMPSYGYGLYGCNYAQPVMLMSYQTSPYVAGGPAPVQSTGDDAGLAEFDAAINAFQYGDYNTALSQVNQAVALRSGDPLVHEFRALVLFALGRYDEAAAGLNALLAVAPGWDWSTLIGLYNNNTGVYVPQLRRLEQYVAANPTDSAARFVLAYHYLVTRSPDAAARQLEEVVRQQPNDQVSARLLQTLKNPPPDELPEPQDNTDSTSAQPLPANPPSGAVPSPATQPTVAPPQGVDASPVAPAPAPASRVTDAKAPEGPTTDLVGKWVAQRENGPAFTLTIDESAAFSWNVSGGPEGTSQKPLTGNYELEGSLLVLGSPDGDVMIGRVTPISTDEFQFVLVGGPPNDPGLRFKRQK